MEPRFLDGYGLNVHLWIVKPDHPARFQCFGTNTHTTSYLKFNEWLEVLSEKYSHIFFSESHYYQVYSYTHKFLRHHFVQATNDMLKNIAEFVSCEDCWSIHVSPNEREAMIPSISIDLVGDDDEAEVYGTLASTNNDFSTIEFGNSY